MPSVNAPSAQNFVVSTGEIWASIFVNDLFTGEWFHVGNCEEFTANLSTDKIQLLSSMEGNRGVLDEANVKQTAEFSMTLNEFNIDNLRMALTGTSVPHTQSAFAAAAATPQNLFGGQPITLGRSYLIGYLNCTGVVFKQGATTLVSGTDYTFDSETGRVTFKSGGAATAAATTWTGTVPAITARNGLAPLTAGKITAAFQYRSAPNQVRGPRKLIDIWRANVTVDGDVAFLTPDKYGQLKIKGSIMNDAANHPTAPYWYEREL